MSRTGSDVMTAVKKDQTAFAGFFSSPVQAGFDMPVNVRFNYTGVRDFIDDFDGKVSYCKNVNQEKLKNKVLVDLNRLNREERLVQKLEEKLAKQGIEVNESSMIKKDLEDLKSLEQFSNNLKKASDGIQGKIDECESHISQMRIEIEEKKHAIRTTNSLVMEISAQKEALSKRLRRLHHHYHLEPLIGAPKQIDENDNYLTSVPESQLNRKDESMKFHKLKGGKSNNISKSTSQPSLVRSASFEMIRKINGETQRVREINQEIRVYFLKKSNGFSEMRKVLQDCFDSQRKRVLKANKVSSPSTGLADSMFFEIGASDEARNRSFFTPPPKAIGSSLSLSKLQDRELRNVLYDTIKQIKASKILKEEMEKEQELLASNKISYAQFRDFSPDQILSLLMVRPEYLHQLLSVFDIKEKTLNLVLLRAKMIFAPQPSFSSSSSSILKAPIDSSSLQILRQKTEQQELNDNKNIDENQ